MEVVYAGKDVKRLLEGASLGYKPRIDGNASTENEKINKKSNKDSLKDTKIEGVDPNFTPVVDRDAQSTDLGNNKNMLDLQFDNDPGKEYVDRVEKLVTGKDSPYGNKPENEEAMGSNKAFYDAAKKASNNFTGKRQELENSGIVGKVIPVGQKSTPFSKSKTQESIQTPETVSNVEKHKKLHFKNTKFLSEKHMFSLIPEDYKINEKKFVMKDKNEDEYLIEWKNDAESKISEAIILKHENKKKLQEEFSKIKSLYQYNSKSQSGLLNNQQRLNEDSNFSKNIQKLREITE